ncbi:class I adenylate-forming enzyme family protein [Cryptosporangium sp. NPDC048952]|uniref:class I adenylate-forming enzyme family protein n=1 Tax=Cryptosporangium sp. NPDC048952 TaxID=3363961 RepID=UPI0037183E24
MTSVVQGPPLGTEPGLGALTLPGFLREVRDRYPDREALVQGSTRWTYADLWDRSFEVAQAVRALGVGKSTRVGVLMTNRPEWVSAVFGITMAGGVAVTLSTFSTASELEYLLHKSGVSVLLYEREAPHRDFTEILDGFSELPYLRHTVELGHPAWDEFLARGVESSPAIVRAMADAVEPSDPAVVFFSSGSTSKPKGVLSAHRAVAIQSWRFSRMYGFTPDDLPRCWPANGLFWSGNFGMAIGATFAAGGAIVLQRTFAAAEALELMQAEKVNFPLAWPHQWAQLASAPNWPDVDLSALRFVDFRTALAQHPTVRGHWAEPFHAYGNTETFTLSACYPANSEEIAEGSSGEPLPGNTFKIVDVLSGDVVPRGSHGEICVKGPTLMLGYLGTPLDETLDSDGYFHTGDGGHLDEQGRLYWSGRLTDIVKTGGANVSPLEVNEVLVAYPGVKVAQTVGVPHDTLGEVVVACVVPHEVEFDVDKLLAYLREHLAAYKVPRHVLLFRSDEIALTGSAKIKSADLRALAAKRLENS